MIRHIQHILTLDIGNSRIKWAFFGFDALIETGHTSLEAIPALIQQWQQGPGLQAVGWMSVGHIREIPVGDFPASRVVRLHTSMNLPIQHAYQTPATLGIDRVVGVVGAQRRAPDQPVLVIDAGTAITYDFADAKGVYQGGAIGPGMQMRFRALHEFTARLPLVSPSAEVDLIGQSTETSIRSGVIQGMTQEIEGTIALYRALAGPTLHVFLTGGDGPFFEKRLKNLNFAAASLLHEGIQAIVQYVLEPSNRHNAH